MVRRTKAKAVAIDRPVGDNLKTCLYASTSLALLLLSGLLLGAGRLVSP